MVEIVVCREEFRMVKSHIIFSISGHKGVSCKWVDTVSFAVLYGRSGNFFGSSSCFFTGPETN